MIRRKRGRDWPILKTSQLVYPILYRAQKFYEFSFHFRFSFRCCSCCTRLWRIPPRTGLRSRRKQPKPSPTTQKSSKIQPSSSSTLPKMPTKVPILQNHSPVTDGSAKLGDIVVHDLSNYPPYSRFGKICTTLATF